MGMRWDKEKKKRLRFFLSFVAQWLEHPTGIRKVIGSIPIGYSAFFLSHACGMLITSFLIICAFGRNLTVTDSGFQEGWGRGLENRFSHPFRLLSLA